MPMIVVVAIGIVGFGGGLILIILAERPPPRPKWRKSIGMPRDPMEGRNRRHQIYRETGIAILTGTLIAVPILLAEQWAEQNRENDRANREQVLENTVFAHELSLGVLDGPKPLAGMNLAGAELSALHLRGATLVETNLTEANLAFAGLDRANLTEANLAGANLTDAFLRGAGLTGANLTGANLTGADLTEADLTEADLTEASLTGANLVGTNLTGANVTDVWWVEGSPPVWPAGFDPPANAGPP